MRIPLTLRSSIGRACQWPPLSRLATDAYWRIAEKCARDFLMVPHVEGVFLRGGMLRKCVPGVSDIDLAVVFSSSINCSDEIRLWKNLCTAFRKLKRKFPMLGEVYLFNRSQWELYVEIFPEHMMYFTRQLEYRPSKGFESLNPTSPYQIAEYSPSPFARFNFCFSLYRRAVANWVAFLRTEKRYFWMEFTKNALKARDWPKGSDLILEDPPEACRLLGEAFHSLHQLAEVVMQEDPPRGIPLRPLPQEAIQGYSEAYLLGFACYQRLSTWCDKQGQLSMTRIPSHVKVRDGGSIEEIFRGYQSCLSPAKHAVDKFPLFLVSDEMYRCLLRSWSRWWPCSESASFLQGVPAPVLDESDQRHLFWSLLNRVSNGLMGLFHSYLSLPPQALREGVAGLAIEAMNLVSPILSRNPDKLVVTCHKDFPDLCALARHPSDYGNPSSAPEEERIAFLLQSARTLETVVRATRSSISLSP